MENGFRGNGFPIIVADATICKESRLFEPKFDEEAKGCDVISADQVFDSEHSKNSETTFPMQHQFMVAAAVPPPLAAVAGAPEEMATKDLIRLIEGGIYRS